MKKPRNEQVKKFIDDIADTDDEKFLILKKLRKIVFDTYPEVDERIMYGGIMFSLSDDFGGAFVSKKHVSFEFSKGFEFDDPLNLLEGAGKSRRHLKLRTIADIDDKQFDFFVKQAT
ncbi:MAG: DUF1801 domain-containing protein [Flavobacteriales bacterium]|nr:DUF1801 domain-containing protein [Flavobacteriales bacterium]